ncbi:MAG: zinc-ribbon domain-containing protein [Candidatus Lernaella stagnicola]|nr:zinc-ribbon domain-containing protein [Candidatus Lernaella stagnicola]
MKATCPICTATYPIPDEVLRGKEAGLPVRCKKCGAIFRAYEDERPPTIQSPPTAAPWSEGLVGPTDIEPDIEKPSIHNLEPSARETSGARRVVRSTYIDRPIPDLDRPPRKPEPPEVSESSWDDHGELPDLVDEPAPSAEPKAPPEPVKPPPLDVPPPPPKPSPLSSKSEQLVMTDLIPPERTAAEEPPPEPEPEPPRVETPTPEPTPPAPPEPEPSAEEVTFEERSPEREPDFYIDDEDFAEPERPFGADLFPDEDDDDDIDIHSDEFLQIRRFGTISKNTQLLLLAAVALVVVLLGYYFLTVTRQVDDAHVNLAARDKDSAASHEESRAKLDYRGNYLRGRRCAEIGTEPAYKEALALFDAALRVRPDFVPALAAKAMTLGMLAAQYGQTAKADPACAAAKQAMERNDTFAFTQRAQAACEMASHRLPEAQNALQGALAAAEGDDHEDAETNYVLAMVYLAQNNAGQAAATLDTAISQNPHHFRILHLRADLHAQKEQWSEAIALEKQALALLDPEHPAHLSALRQTKERLAQWEKGSKAVALTEPTPKPVEPAPVPTPVPAVKDKPPVANSMAQCRSALKRSDFQAAIAACSEARSVNSDAYYFLAAAYEATSNQALSKQNYQSYLQHRPNGRYAGEVRSILGYSRP